MGTTPSFLFQSISPPSPPRYLASHSMEERGSQHEPHGPGWKSTQTSLCLQCYLQPRPSHEGLSPACKNKCNLLLYEASDSTFIERSEGDVRVEMTIESALHLLIHHITSLSRLTNAGFKWSKTTSKWKSISFAPHFGVITSQPPKNFIYFSIKLMWRSCRHA